ncbi:hypothetical protein P7K49_024581 [Saguinus oedipus]|uniref:Uncharacterized protein n=1 Tax=Saguinus oedipus TaxID=9490 RepID=A0ABQ9UQP8_SAGOE|nr:hypothetical protein P7K49_024581 [Saguinus oedipus]
MFLRQRQRFAEELREGFGRRRGPGVAAGSRRPRGSADLLAGDQEAPKGSPALPPGGQCGHCSQNAFPSRLSGERLPAGRSPGFAAHLSPGQGAPDTEGNQSSANLSSANQSVVLKAPSRREGVGVADPRGAPTCSSFSCSSSQERRPAAPSETSFHPGTIPPFPALSPEPLRNPDLRYLYCGLKTPPKTVDYEEASEGPITTLKRALESIKPVLIHMSQPLTNQWLGLLKHGALSAYASEEGTTIASAEK